MCNVECEISYISFLFWTDPTSNSQLEQKWKKKYKNSHFFFATIAQAQCSAYSVLHTQHCTLKPLFAFFFVRSSCLRKNIYIYVFSFRMGRMHFSSSSSSCFKPWAWTGRHCVAILYLLTSVTWYDFTFLFSFFFNFTSFNLCFVLFVCLVVRCCIIFCKSLFGYRPQYQKLLFSLKTELIWHP